MAYDRQAVSRLRARGPRRVVPPEAPVDRERPAPRQPHGDSAGRQGGNSTRVGRTNARTTREAGEPAEPGEPGDLFDQDAAETNTGQGPEPSSGSGDVRPRGVTRRGRLRRTWLDRGDGYRIWAGGPVPHGASAWTLNTWVIVRRRSAHNRALMAHEEEHVRQWAERGRVGFLTWYLRHYLLWRLRGYPHQSAYRRIPAEIEAEWRSRRRLGIGCQRRDPSTDN